MNRAICILAVAIVTIAFAHCGLVDDEFNEAATRATLSTTPSEETALLAEANMEAFAPFCIQSRDYVFADLKTKAGTVSSQGFSYFFSMAEDVARKALEANIDATSRLSNQLAEPSAEVVGDDEVAEAQRQVAAQNQPRALMTAFSGAITATTNAFISVLKEKGAQIKEFADVSVFLNVAQQGCSQVEEYDAEIRSMFRVFKQNVPEKHQAEVKNVRIETVPCVTAKRISRVNGFCGLINSAYAPFLKFLGIGSVKLIDSKQLD